MTALEELLAYIDGLSDEDALSLWHRIQFEEAFPPEPLTPKQREMVERGMEDARAGRTIPHEEVMRRMRLRFEDRLG